MKAELTRPEPLPIPEPEVVLTMTKVEAGHLRVILGWIESPNGRSGAIATTGDEIYRVLGEIIPLPGGLYRPFVSSVAYMEGV